MSSCSTAVASMNQQIIIDRLRQEATIEPDAQNPNRLGVLGDAPKANCATCHQGAYKPLNGAPMVKDYPELAPATAPKVSYVPVAASQ